MLVQGKTIGDLYQTTINHFNVAVKIEKNTQETADNTQVLPEMLNVMKALNKNSGDSLSAQLRAAGKYRY